MFCLTAMCVVTHCCGVGVVSSCSLSDTLYSTELAVFGIKCILTIMQNPLKTTNAFFLLSFSLNLPLYGGTSDFLGFGIGVIQQNTSVPCTNLSM